MENIPSFRTSLNDLFIDLRGPRLTPQEVDQLLAKLPDATIEDLDNICAKLRNKADACIAAKDQSMYEKIYTRLLEIGISLQLAGKPEHAYCIYVHLCGPSEKHIQAFSSPLQQEASVRRYMHDYTVTIGRPIEEESWKPEGPLRQMYATAANTPGRSMAAYELGKMYEEGKPQGMEQNVEKSIELYKKAADEGCTLAQVALPKLEATIEADAITKQLNDQKMAEEKALMEQREREFSQVANSLKSHRSHACPDWYDNDKAYREKVANTR